MRVLKTNSYTKRYTLQIYKKLIQDYIEVYWNTPSLKEIRNMFSDDEVISCVDDIYRDGDYICINSSNKILRYLQYGGRNIKALNLLSLAYLKLEGGML